MPGPAGPTAPPEPPVAPAPPPVEPEPPPAPGAPVPGALGATTELDALGRDEPPVVLGIGAAVDEVELLEVLDGPLPDCDPQAASSTLTVATALTAMTAEHVRADPPVRRRAPWVF
ncbi:hypothetical protein MMAD_15660 [Mycolicibacterium madagascariense]|uniref:Uncharacterized protein n=2 Tax=Mycolicibacterium madagascariense TaxID=212765 RepID=A0A7I7XEB2_9MYCO|nr:hypothetical protein MMAD_15660 [Mycolicibacterium madagascariense]